MINKYQKIILHSDNINRTDRFGLSRYAIELIESLCSIHDNLEFQPTYAYSELNSRNDFGYIKVGWNRKLTSLMWTTLKNPKIESWVPEVNLVHSLDLDYPIATNKPLVVTVHDIGVLTHPQYFSKGKKILKRAALKQAAKQADMIICVSQATAFDCQNYLQQNLSHKIQVIYEGVSSAFFSPPSSSSFNNVYEKINIEAPFFLYPGSVNPRKNLVRVLEAFETVAKDIPHHLVMVGKLGWDTNEVLTKLKDSPLANRIHFLGFVSDLELIALYQHATALIYVSFFEGFGLPILEAMASGCPVITSNVSSMPEVADDAGIIVDPFSVEAISDALKLVANDQEKRDSLIERGLERAKLFSWARCAELTGEIYKSILDN